MKQIGFAKHIYAAADISRGSLQGSILIKEFLKRQIEVLSLDKKIVLASASPRRRELLQNMGLDFEIITSDGAEQVFENELPQDTVKRLSSEKALNVAKRAPYDDCIVIGADTVVAIDGKILGKPVDEGDAKRMLTLLSGRTHKVYTGVSVIETISGERVSDYVETEVKFVNLTERQIEKYVSSGEPMDKAGAYGIQDLGAMLVEKINGDYFNVVGLPVSRLAGILRDRFGVDTVI